MLRNKNLGILANDYSEQSNSKPKEEHAPAPGQTHSSARPKVQSSFGPRLALFLNRAQSCLPRTAEGDSKKNKEQEPAEIAI